MEQKFKVGDHVTWTLKQVMFQERSLKYILLILIIKIIRITLQKMILNMKSKVINQIILLRVKVRRLLRSKNNIYYQQLLRLKSQQKTTKFFI
jgi:hypothetical protein